MTAAAGEPRTYTATAVCRHNRLAALCWICRPLDAPEVPRDEPELDELEDAVLDVINMLATKYEGVLTQRIADHPHVRRLKPRARALGNALHHLHALGYIKQGVWGQGPGMAR